MKFPHRAVVQIKKPHLKKKRRVDGINWSPSMDFYNGMKVMVYSDYGTYVRCFRDKENPRHPEGYYLDDFNWHKSWLIPITVDKDGNSEPYDNQRNSKCYWCEGPLKRMAHKIEGGGSHIFIYCPRCQR